MKQSRTLYALAGLGTLVASWAMATYTKNRSHEHTTEHYNKPMKKDTTMEPHINITHDDRAASANILNNLLADEYVLYTKTLNYHWNVVGPFFGPLHGFFGKHYEELLEIIDSVAERARALGQPAIGSMTQFLQHTRLEEDTGAPQSAEAMIANLLNDHEAIIRVLRVDLDVAANKHNDIGTNNFLTDLLERHEKMAWMLRAHLQK